MTDNPKEELIMRVRNYEEAINQAQANANRTQTPRWIFRDTNGVWNVETRPNAASIIHRIDPKPTVETERAMRAQYDAFSSRPVKK
jgi:hypothetical protein